MNERNTKACASGVTVRKEVSDLGKAAYLMMHGHKVIGRRGRGIWFEVATTPGTSSESIPERTELDDFEDRQIEYLRGPYHTFDSCLMSLKKFDDYLPHE